MADPITPPPPPRTQTMYGRDGKPVEVPVGDVAARFREGSLAFAKGQTVHLADPSTGQIVPMSGDAAGKILGTIEGAVTRVTHGQDFADQQEAKAFDTVGQGVAAAGLGLARGATVGISDAAIAKVGGEGARKYLQKQQKHNAGASAVGEVAGMIAPALLTGGASAEAGAVARLGRGATAVSRGVTAGAETGGRLVERGLVGLGAEEGGRVAGAGRILAQNALEGGAQAVGQAVSDASIKNEPITVEKLTAAMGHGALLGGALGGALHGTVHIGKTGVNKVGSAVKESVTDALGSAREKLVNKIAGAVEGDTAALGARAEAAAGRVEAGVADAAGAPGVAGVESAAGAPKSDIRTQLREFLDSASKGDVDAMAKQGDAFVTKRAAEQIGIATEGKTEAELRHLIADKQSISSLSPTVQKTEEKLRKLSADVQKDVVTTIEEDVRRVAGKDARSMMTRQEIADASKVVKREAGEGMESILKKFDDAAAGDATKLPSLKDSAKRIDDEVIAPLLAEVEAGLGPKGAKGIDGGTRKRIAEGLDEFLESYRDKGTISHKRMHEVRRYLDEGINWKPGSDAEKLKSQVFRKARNILDDDLAAAGDRAMGNAGGEAALEWKAAKNKWAAANFVAEASEIGAMRDAKNRVYGMSELMTSNKYSAIGTAVGGAAGSIVPVFGTAVGGLAGGLAGSFLGNQAANFTRRYGDQYIAKIAREAGTDGVLRRGMQEVDKLLDSKLGTFLGEKGLQGAAAVKNNAADLLARGEKALNEAIDKAGAPVAVADKAATRAADAAERTATRVEEKVAADAAKVAAQVEAAAPGQVRRALVEKLASIKEAGAARVAAIREKAAELGERAGRVRKALPGAPTLGLEAERVQKRIAAADEETYEKKRQQYADLAQSPARIDQATAAVRVGRPDLANALGAKLAEITAYVNAQAPASTQTPLTPGMGKDLPSPSEQARFLAIARAAENPLSVLDDLEKGTLTSEQMQVVRDLYPELHADLVTRVVSKLADRKRPLPYAQRLQLGILLAAPTDPSLEPDFIAETQASFAKPQPPAPMPGALGKRKPAAVGAATSKMSALETGALE